MFPVDTDGYLHLEITNNGGAWTASELFTTDKRNHRNGRHRQGGSSAATGGSGSKAATGSSGCACQVANANGSPLGCLTSFGGILLGLRRRLRRARRTASPISGD